MLGGDLLLRLTRIAFIIIATPVVIITLLTGHRIDDTRNNTTIYPLRVEVTGIIIGIILGSLLSFEWAFLLTLSIGTIWADPFLYSPFPIFTLLITYLCFKGSQYFYSRTHTLPFKQSFRLPFILLLFSLPVLLYSIYALASLLMKLSPQNEVTITNLKEIPSGDSYMVLADLTVPESGLYHVTASVGPTPHYTTPLALRLNGVANIDGLYNFELNKGINQLTYHPSAEDCAFTQGKTVSTNITFSVSLEVGGRFTTPLPHQIKENINCRGK